MTQLRPPPRVQISSPWQWTFARPNPQTPQQIPRQGPGRGAKALTSIRLAFNHLRTSTNWKRTCWYSSDENLIYLIGEIFNCLDSYLILLAYLPDGAVSTLDKLANRLLVCSREMLKMCNRLDSYLIFLAYPQDGAGSAQDELANWLMVRSRQRLCRSVNKDDVQRNYFEIEDWPKLVPDIEIQNLRYARLPSFVSFKFMDDFPDFPIEMSIYWGFPS